MYHIQTKLTMSPSDLVKFGKNYCNEDLHLLGCDAVFWVSKFTESSATPL